MTVNRKFIALWNCIYRLDQAKYIIATLSATGYQAVNLQVKQAPSPQQQPRTQTAWMNCTDGRSLQPKEVMIICMQTSIL